MKPTWIALAACLFPTFAQAQTALWVKDDHAIELNSFVIGYAMVPLVPDSLNLKPEVYLRDWRLQLSGIFGPGLEAHVQVDAANFLLDPVINPVLDAYVKIDLKEQFDLFAGYQLVPFSRNSLVSIRQSPFANRTLLADGNLFARRDFGIYLKKQAFSNRFNGFAGVFSGTGKLVPPVGKNMGIAAVARGEMAFPSRFRHEEVDIRYSPIPRWVAGANVYFSRQRQDSTRFLLPFQTNGTSLVSGVDASFCYQGVSLQAEGVWAGIAPANAERYQVWGGFVSGNYYFKKLHSVLAVRYEAYTTTALHTEKEPVQVMHLSWNLMLDQSHKQMIRVDYGHYRREFEQPLPLPGLTTGLQVGLQLSL